MYLLRGESWVGRRLVVVGVVIVMVGGGDGGGGGGGGGWGVGKRMYLRIFRNWIYFDWC